MKDKLIWYILPKICKYLVRQGHGHQYNIEKYYRVMNNEFKEQFTEDNGPTREAFLIGCFQYNLNWLKINTELR